MVIGEDAACLTKYGNSGGLERPTLDKVRLECKEIVKGAGERFFKGELFHALCDCEHKSRLQSRFTNAFDLPIPPMVRGSVVDKS